MTHGNWLEMIDGSQYWLASDRNDPDASAFALSIEALAKQLSQINRFNGATRWPYSVAQHSVWVSEALDVDANWALAGLLHDAHEVVVSDVPRPVKLEMRDRGEGKVLDQLAKEADARIFQALGIEYPLTRQVELIVSHVDDVALATERRDLLIGQEPWAHLPEPHPTKLQMMVGEQAAKAFVKRFHHLVERATGGKPAGTSDPISEIIDGLIPTSTAGA